MKAQAALVQSGSFPHGMLDYGQTSHESLAHKTRKLTIITDLVLRN